MQSDMKIEGSVALVTGANRGLGAEFSRQLLGRGAAKVYGAARDPDQLRDDRLVPVRLDVTDRGSIEAAANTATDVTLLVNNAGIMTDARVVGDEEQLRREIEVNYLGTVAVTRAFAPILAANGGGAVLNVLSVLSWVTLPTTGGYSAAKAASWAATNALRHELHKNGTRVLALHVGYMDTDMTKDVEAPKSAPSEVAAKALDGLEAGEQEVLADDTSRNAKAGLARPPSDLYPTVA